ncbi:hypothetical protein A3740_18535 [Oleiphilus sp. HI0068]|uniref:DUF7674 family protein n=1 Tax=unclassified Oleiphilus TaxID=2631174 RepID=UPI0007C20428|nr:MULTISPECIES: hypothetical protein [unclassified Oleiphilus]KZY73657.1 hypothetical protein A3740_18535 [Oleiphilus sp. HI0068]KZY80538.1 hypothetical protein A3741_18640 [Oleiphilus sp. HI0069]KZY57429.1 hypothetical protein A3735_18600 [Oleiphilus sp. HI0061]KZY81008.1 hypothetical protein A3741_18090 [Oleiphilus sp. HI0069]KZZ75325.1 hypothetical protein A3766_17015 [Oleiphilus sp. HI0132]
MSIQTLYEEFRVQFPETTKKVDYLYSQEWGDPSKDQAFMWFEFLAKILNREMIGGVSAKTYDRMFQFMRSQFMVGNEKVKNCIDVAFTENLFWQVPKEKALDYWALFPEVLKDLYVKFHHRKPA